MTYNIYQFEGTNLWGCVSPQGSLISHASRRQCIAAATHDAMQNKSKCTIKCEVIRPASLIIEHLNKII